MADRVTGDRVEKTPRRELDRKDFDAVRVGGVLTDSRAPSRNASPAQVATQGEGGGTTPSSLRILEADGDPNVSNVRTIVVPNDSLTDDGGGQVTLAISGGITLLTSESYLLSISEFVDWTNFIVPAEVGGVAIPENILAIIMELRVRTLTIGDPGDAFSFQVRETGETGEAQYFGALNREAGYHITENRTLVMLKLDVNRSFDYRLGETGGGAPSGTALGRATLVGYLG